MVSISRACCVLVWVVLVSAAVEDRPAEAARARTSPHAKNVAKKRATARRAPRVSRARSQRPARTFRNPVIDADFADPSVVRGHDGALYAYATQNAEHNVQVMQSRDNGVTWKRLPDALPVRARWSDGSRNRNTWAPDVSLHRGVYYLYFSAEVNAKYAAEYNRTRPRSRHIEAGSMAIGVATSRSPAGPFRPEATPLRVGANFQNIDAMAFTDVKHGGRRILYWGSNDLGIMAQELDESGLGFKRGTTARRVLSVRPDRPYQRLLEAAFVVYNEPDDTYYLMVSGDDCCGGGDAQKAKYAVLVASSRDPFGPFEIIAGATPEAEDTVLRAGAPDATGRRAIGPGHNGVFEVGKQRWMAFHYIDSSRPYDPGSNHPRRPMGIAPFDIVNGRLVIGDGTPPLGPQLRPGDRPRPRPRRANRRDPR